MARPFRMHRTTRRRLFWLVTLLMLWQQTALAAYVCPTVPKAATATALVNSMPGMDDGCAQHQESPASPLCQKHCAPEHTTQVEAHTASVPLSPLPAMPPMLISPRPSHCHRIARSNGSGICARHHLRPYCCSAHS